MSTEPSPSRSGTPEDPTRTVEMSALVADRQIGAYRLVRQLGEGGMGVVYHAEQLQPIRREVALKIIKPGMDSKQVIARFESERQALALMDHPNIARVFDAGTTTSGLPYFVMELVDGVPITRYCDGKRLTVEERIKLFIPVCRAIQHAHQKGIIHRDIKPSNILVKQQDSLPVPEVIDFGLAKALSQQMSDATMLTNLNTVVGTFNYMSPEQAEVGRHDIDTRSDVYSLGAVLYELLTGTTPLERLEKASYVEVLQRVREAETPRPSVRVRQSGTLGTVAEVRGSDPAGLPKLLDRELDWIAMKALEKDRTRRYETANGLARDLQRYLDGELVEAAPPSAAYRVDKFVRKHKWKLATAAAFTAILVTGVVVSTWEAVRAHRAEQTAQAVNDFLRTDLLAQAGATAQSAAGSKPDPDLKVRTALDRAASRVTGAFDRQPEVEAAIRDTIGETYLDLGLYQDARTQLERALDLHCRTDGQRDPKTLKAAARLGRVAFLQGRNTEAETRLASVLKAQRQVMGAGHADTLYTMNNLANTYYAEERYKEAERLHSEVLDIRRRALGPDHPDTLTSMSNLAVVYAAERKLNQAEQLHRQVLEIRRRTLGPDHPQTLGSMRNLAYSLVLQAKYQEGSEILEQVLEASRRVLGEEHPGTLDAMFNLGQTEYGSGKQASAAVHLTRALDAMRRVLGPQNPSTLICMRMLGYVYVAQADYARALALLSRTLEISRKESGEEEPETLDTLSAISYLYEKESKYALAEQYAAEALAKWRRKLGSDYLKTQMSACDLALAYVSQDKFTQSTPLAREAIDFYLKHDPDEWQRFRAESLLGASLAGQKKYAEAENLLLGGYRGMLARQEAMDYREFHLERARDWIFHLYQAWGKPEEAAQWKPK